MAGGGCFDFDGTSNGYVTMSALTGMNGAVGATQVFWINWDAIPSDTRSAGGFHNGFTNSSICYNSTETSTFGTNFLLNTSNRKQPATTTAPGSLFSTNTWYHYVCTWDGVSDAIGNFKLYMNTTSQTIAFRWDSGTLTALGTNTTALEWGCLSPGTFAMNGRLAYCGMYSRGMTVDEVQEIQFNPFAFADGMETMTPMYSSTPVDIGARGAASAVGSGATLNTDGPPIYLWCGQ